MKRVFGIGLLLLLPLTANAEDLVQIPGGQIEAIWLSPVSRQNKPTTSKLKRMVKVKAFQTLRYPVTNSEFVEFLKKHPEWRKESAPSLYADGHYLSNLKTTVEKADKSPITYVSWYAARAYCESIGMRLPTVNEWEYMAAASETKQDANRDANFLKRILEWYGEPQAGSLKPVGSIYKNMYGVWDLHGLIWEWVEDFNSTFVTGESREDGSFNKEMFCGAGSMSSSDKENYAAYMRFAFRSSLKGRSSVWNLGFRCVK